MNKKYFYVIATLTTFFIGLIIFNYQLKKFDLNQRRLLTQYINTVRASISPDQVSLLSGTPADLVNPSYLYLKEKFTTLASSFPNIRYLYLMRLDQGQVIFLIDAEPNNSISTEPLATPGEIYQSANNNLLRVFSQDKIITVGPEVDKWGSFVSVLAPVKDRQQNIISLIGADIDSTTWRQEAVLSTYPTLVVLLIFLLFEYFLIATVLKYKNHQDTISYLATVLSSSSDAIISIDLEGSIKSWNPGAQKIFGYTEFEAIGKHLTDLIYPPGHDSEFNDLISKIKDGQKINNFESIRYHKTRKQVTVLITESPIIKHEVVVGASVVYKDITIESQSKKNLTSRNQELEKLNSLMVDRELKMIELKKQIKKLKMSRA